MVAVLIFMPVSPAAAHSYAAPIEDFFDPAGDTHFGCEKPQLEDLGLFPDDFEGWNFSTMRTSSTCATDDVDAWLRVSSRLRHLDYGTLAVTECGSPYQLYTTDYISGNTDLNTFRYGWVYGWKSAHTVKLEQSNSNIGLCDEGNSALFTLVKAGVCIAGDCYDMYEEGCDEDWYAAYHDYNGDTGETWIEHSSAC